MTFRARQSPRDAHLIKRPPPERVTALVGTLLKRGVLTKLRQSAGQDVDGGCGQLQARLMTATAIEKRAEFSYRVAPRIIAKSID